jgi:hypothetical protein
LNPLRWDTCHRHVFMRSDYLLWSFVESGRPRRCGVSCHALKATSPATKPAWVADATPHGFKAQTRQGTGHRSHGVPAMTSRICGPYLASLFSPTPLTRLSAVRVVGASVAIWRRVVSWKTT